MKHNICAMATNMCCDGQYTRYVDEYALWRTIYTLWRQICVVTHNIRAMTTNMRCEAQYMRIDDKCVLWWQLCAVTQHLCAWQQIGALYGYLDSGAKNRVDSRLQSQRSSGLRAPQLKSGWRPDFFRFSFRLRTPVYSIQLLHIFYRECIIPPKILY